MARHSYHGREIKGPGKKILKTTPTEDDLKSMLLGITFRLTFAHSAIDNYNFALHKSDHYSSKEYGTEYKMRQEDFEAQQRGIAEKSKAKTTALLEKEYPAGRIVSDEEFRERYEKVLAEEFRKLWHLRDALKNQDPAVLVPLWRRQRAEMEASVVEALEDLDKEIGQYEQAKARYESKAGKLPVRIQTEYEATPEDIMETLAKETTTRLMVKQRGANLPNLERILHE